MIISIFSSPINIFKSLLKPSYNIESVFLLPFFSYASQPYSVYSISLTVFRTCFKKKRATQRCGHNANNQFFHLFREKNTYALDNWNKHFHSRNFMERANNHTFDSKQIMTENRYENTIQTAFFESKLKHSYILYTFHNKNQFVGWKWKI